MTLRKISVVSGLFIILNAQDKMLTLVKIVFYFSFEFHAFSQNMNYAIFSAVIRSRIIFSY